MLWQNLWFVPEIKVGLVKKVGTFILCTFYQPHSLEFYPESQRIFGFLFLRLKHLLFPKIFFFYYKILLNFHIESKWQMSNDFRIRFVVDVKTVFMTKRSRVLSTKSICSSYLLIHALMDNIDFRLEISRFILQWEHVSNVTDRLNTHAANSYRDSVKCNPITHVRIS
jgi:hypothetical protein